jgi:hypothetical protein
MKLFLRFNKVNSPDMKITATISWMRGGTAGNFATHWMDKVANTDCYNLKGKLRLQQKTKT